MHLISTWLSQDLVSAVLLAVKTFVTHANNILFNFIAFALIVASLCNQCILAQDVDQLVGRGHMVE